MKIRFYSNKKNPVGKRWNCLKKLRIKEEKNDVDIFGSIQQEELIYYGAGGEAKRQKVHVREIEGREAELKKAKSARDKKEKVKEQLRKAEFLKVRKETRIENSRKWKSGGSQWTTCKNDYNFRLLRTSINGPHHPHFIDP